MKKKHFVKNEKFGLGTTIYFTVIKIYFFAENILKGVADLKWPKRSLAWKKVLIAIFKSAKNGNTVVELWYNPLYTNK